MTHPSESTQVRSAWARRRRRRQITAAGVCGGVACIMVVWAFTLWPGAALVSGAVVGPAVAFVYKLLYDYAAPRNDVDGIKRP